MLLKRSAENFSGDLLALFIDGSNYEARTEVRPWSPRLLQVGERITHSERQPPHATQLPEALGLGPVPSAAQTRVFPTLPRLGSDRTP